MRQTLTWFSPVFSQFSPRSRHGVHYSKLVIWITLNKFVNKARLWICSRKWQNFGNTENKRISTHILCACWVHDVSAKVNQSNKAAEDKINCQIIRDSVCVGLNVLCRHTEFTSQPFISLHYNSFSGKLLWIKCRLLTSVTRAALNRK
jgi:hypothetical protein